MRDLNGIKIAYLHVEKLLQITFDNGLSTSISRLFFETLYLRQDKYFGGNTYKCSWNIADDLRTDMIYEITRIITSRWSQSDYYVRLFVEHCEYSQTITYRVKYFDVRLLQETDPSTEADDLLQQRSSVRHSHLIVSCVSNNLAPVRQSTNAANSRINQRPL